MKIKIYSLALSLLLIFAASVQTQAQIQTPAASPAASVSQNVGFTKISIDYSSPAVKGRKIFGEIEKFGTPWRAGANAPTIIEFSTPVNIGGTNLRPGKYSIFMTPQETGEWTIHFNSKGNSIFAYMPGGNLDKEALAKDEAVSIKVNPVRTNDVQERLTYGISAGNNKVAQVHFGWEKIRISFEVDTQADQKMESFKSQMN
ncbi:MAG TPA: DUF2911 domain-containing protein [Anditalea sp.]|nr:DUF2911 domain-containing protein [Anditalea sp.]